MSRLSQVILAECQKRFISKVALAKMLNLSRDAIYQRYSGKVQWKDLELKELCRVWCLPLDYFNQYK